MALANLTQAAALGFESGKGQGAVNPLGQFIRGMVSDWRQKRLSTQAMQTELAGKKELEGYKIGLEGQTPKAQAEANYYNQLAEYMKKSAPGGVVEGDETNLNTLNPGYDLEDYINKPTRASVRGIPTTINVPTLKEDLTSDQSSQIKDVSNAVSMIDRLIELSHKVKTGIIASTRLNPNSPFNKFLMGSNPKEEEANFKSTYTQLQASHAKAESGAARGFKEIGFLSSALPEVTYESSRFISTSKETKRRYEINLRNMLISANREGRKLGTENRKMLATLTQKYPLEKYPLGIQMQNDGGEVSDKVQNLKSKYGLE
jgi:hypothetical protein